MATKTAPRPTRDLHAEITERIIAALESGTAPWRSPYTARTGAPLSLSTAKPYRGVNALLLALAGEDAGYGSQYWGTYKAITDKGGQVRKGEKGTTVIFWKRTVRTVTSPEGNDEEKGGVFMRHYVVFNAEQADGLGAAFGPTERPEGWDPITAAEDVVHGYVGRPAITSERQDVAYYSPSADKVSVPRAENLSGRSEYYSTLFHELIHSTGHTSRLARDGVVALGTHRRGEVYAFEELIAEFGAGILSGHVGIEDTIDNSAAYLRGWASHLRSDPKAVIRAAAAAQKAVDRVLGTTFGDEAE